MEEEINQEWTPGGGLDSGFSFRHKKKDVVRTLEVVARGVRLTKKSAVLQSQEAWGMS